MGTTKNNFTDSNLPFNLFKHVEKQIDADICFLSQKLESKSLKYFRKLVKVPFFEDMCKINKNKAD